MKQAFVITTDYEAEVRIEVSDNIVYVFSTTNDITSKTDATNSLEIVIGEPFNATTN